jgi:hypothetical protein
VTGEAPTFDKSCWFDIKFSLGLDFPNLPYYMDGESHHYDHHYEQGDQIGRIFAHWSIIYLGQFL